MRDFASGGVWEAIRHHLVVMLREQEGREPSATAAIVDTQSVKTTEKGATSMVYRAEHWSSAAGAWTRGLLERRPVRLVTVALANKMARIAWALMTRKEVYRATGRAAEAAGAPA